MPAAALPVDEADRLRALRRLAVLDSEREDPYDHLVDLAAQLLGARHGAVSLVDADRQWFKACSIGHMTGTDRARSFCSHAILSDGITVVRDATADPRFTDNPLVLGPDHFRFYVGAPLVLGDGHTVGTLCVWDTETREVSDEQLRLLAGLARQVVALLELREARLYYRAALSATSQVLIHLDAAGHVLTLSPEWRALTGHWPAALLGQHVRELVHPGDHGALEQLLDAGRRTTERRVLEVRLPRASGGDVPGQLRIVSLTDADGRLLGQLGTVIDLTEWHQREVETRHAQKLEALGRLSAGLAHEINTPIQFVGDNTRFLADAYSSILGLVQCYRTALAADSGAMAWDARRAMVDRAEAAADLDWLEEEVPGAVQQSLEGVDRVASLVRAMKAFSYKDQDRPLDADLNDAVRTTVTVARNEIKYVADVLLDLGELPPVRCHIGDLNQVFLNLLVNAADAIETTGRRGTIRVATSVEGPDVVVDIADDGPGIPEQVLDRIFEPFFTTKGVGRGTGQGLALARAVVQDRHGGRIEVETAEGVGTRFRLRLRVGGPTTTAQPGAGVPAQVQRT